MQIDIDVTFVTGYEKVEQNLYKKTASGDRLHSAAGGGKGKSTAEKQHRTARLPGVKARRGGSARFPIGTGDHAGHAGE